MILHCFFFHQTLNRYFSYIKNKGKKIRKIWPVKVYSNLNDEWNHYDGLWERNSRGKGLQLREAVHPKWLPPLSLRVHFGKDFALKVAYIL